MVKLCPNIAPHRRFVWLLWLLLLLPMAQTAATLHGYAHGLASEPEGTYKVDGKHAFPHGPCGICLIAAAFVGGAPPAEPPALSQSTALYQAPNANSGSVWISPIFPAYEGRAPPVALR